MLDRTTQEPHVPERDGQRHPGRSTARALAPLAAVSAWMMMMSAAPPAGAVVVQGAQVIAIVNAQRAANGIPPITTDDQAYASFWCPNEDGAVQPGESGRVWAPDDTWALDTTPYTTAPLHQQVVYSPLATVAGDLSFHGQDCMGVGEPELEASLDEPPEFYAFVNELGPRHAVVSELADELPTTPQQEVGFPLDHRTGPQIILWAEGMGFSPKPALVSLRTATGRAVPGARLAPGFRDAILVPPVLEPSTHYLLEVSWTAEEQTFTPEGTPSVVGGASDVQTVTFTTQAATRPSVRPSPRRRHRRRRG